MPDRLKGDFPVEFMKHGGFGFDRFFEAYGVRLFANNSRLEGTKC